jgi:dUTP pyrophosphatase
MQRNDDMRTRGFEICKGFEQSDITLPTRATKQSAGYDLASLEEVSIKPGEMSLIKTGLKAYMCEDEVLKIYIRSSIAVKRHAMLANNVGVIDADYYGNDQNDGHIMIPIVNFGNDVLNIKKGEKIAQGIFEKYLIVDHDCIVDEIRTGGFGSSNKI